MLRRIYIVEDEEEVANIMMMSINTLNEIYPVEVKTFPQYESFREAIDEVAPDLILIDLMLPTKSGYDILRELKANRKFKDIPVVIVSAKVAEYERYMCLEAGAVAYFTKPFFGMLELNSAIKNFIKIPKGDIVVTCGDLVIDSSVRIVTKNKKPLELSHKEFELLRYLVINNNVPLSKEDIYRNVWDETYIKSRTIDMHIKFLRQKVFYDDQDVIKTITKFGYKLVYDTE